MIPLWLSLVSPMASKNKPSIHEKIILEAKEFDEQDDLKNFKNLFDVPQNTSGKSKHYFCGNSLGCMPKSAEIILKEEIEKWKTLGVDGHFYKKTGWFDYHELLREGGSHITGSLPCENVFMNSLTINLHLLLTSFWRPETGRDIIVMDAPTFPSDTFAVREHIRARGGDPDQLIKIVSPRKGECITDDDIFSAIKDAGNRFSTAIIAGVNYLTGQAFCLQKLAENAHNAGGTLGCDLAHAIGNVELQLHDWEVDFAVWCSYKYLNGGPGAIGGAYIHQKHANAKNFRLAGWWGNEPATRFQMQSEKTFIPKKGIDGWQVSNPPIFSTAPLRASLEIFSDATMGRLRKKSIKLNKYLRKTLKLCCGEKIRIITPEKEKSHGSQISIRINGDLKIIQEKLFKENIVIDTRDPNIIRLAPVPLYNSFYDCAVAAIELGHIVKQA